MEPERNAIKSEEAILRGQAVEMFARLERGLDAVIASYYVPRQPLQTHFALDFLASEWFSFGMRRTVFESIVKRHGWFENKRMQHLRNAGQWRNFLAHVAGMETHVYSDDANAPPKIGYEDPRSRGTVLTVQEAFERFKPECEQASAYVSEVVRRIVPMDKHMRPGHIVEKPIAAGDTFEDWVNAPWKPEL
jgi:hypothetical protein